MCDNTVTKNSTTPQVCRYTTLWNIKCLQSNNWKQDDFSNNTFDEVKAYEKTCAILGHPVHSLNHEEKSLSQTL